MHSLLGNRFHFLQALWRKKAEKEMGVRDRQEDEERQGG
jgi:hypothetical protein